MECWYCSYCPECEKKNWIYGGDPNDMTGFDPDGVKCWSCGTCWRLSNDDEEEDEEVDEDLCDLGQNFEEVKPKAKKK